jgi:hypothetical protein
MPRTKTPIRFLRHKIEVETGKCCGGWIHCVVCDYRGRADMVIIHKRRRKDRAMQRCPECKSLNIIRLEDVMGKVLNDLQSDLIPQCPIHGEMKLVEVTQGDMLLGFVWFCKVEQCQECEDYDPNVHGERVAQFLTDEDVEEDEPIMVLPAEACEASQLSLFVEEK